MDIRIIKEPVSKEIVSEIAKEFYGNMVKGVVDIEREIVALGGEWHADANKILTEDGSRQSDVWGFNFYLNRPEGEEIEYLALINIRPADNNRDMYIEDPKIREKIKNIVVNIIS